MVMAGCGALVSLVLAAVAGRTLAVVDFCDVHTFETDASHLQFTKELCDWEYALAGKFKSLHCCAKGYRSIEWFKDGAPYPWSSGVSNMIVYPESANQTVYAQTASAIDAGNYSCVARNDSHAIRHRVALHVFDAEVEEVGYAGSPRPTCKPKDQLATRGQSARFFCEAFVGRVDLPDAKSEVRWWRSIPSSEGASDWIAADSAPAAATEAPSEQDPGSRHHHHHHQYHRAKHHSKPKPRFHQEVVPREDGQILGAYLLIRDIQSEDYGEYSCSVQNTGGENALRMSSWLREREDEVPEVVEKEMVQPPRLDNSLIIYAIVGALCTMLMFLMIMVMMAWRAKVYRLLKKFCKKKEDVDGKEYGICVFYEGKGRTFSSGANLETSKCMVLSSIMPAFESHHGSGYQCFSQPPPCVDHLPLKEEKVIDVCPRLQ
ncbi:uncharacterized protein [Hetaerina americana]|uniref:uncharacterized protein isoform X2 n=1 Tax=Hetaerina americana TaxID=62018 RepID=UPI003A7F2874